jgi:hypothetical protein
MGFADGHNPVFGGIVLVDIEEVVLPFVNGDEFVLDRRGVQSGGAETGKDAIS